MNAPVVELEDIGKIFPGKSRHNADTVAVTHVSLAIGEGEVLGLVGESGSGKTTLARLMLALTAPTSGVVRYSGKDLNAISRRELTALRPRFQMVFQDTYDSLNPRMSVRDIVAYPLKFANWQGDRGARVDELLEVVGLNASHAGRFPHAFSGGQRQRIAIARALAANPEFLILDEPVSSLDVSIQAQILNLLRDLQASFGLTYLLIANNLGVVRHACTKVAVMFAGSIVESGTVEEIFLRPQHPYTQALLASTLNAESDLSTLSEVSMEISSLRARRGDDFGCIFADVCPRAQEICGIDNPPLEPKVGPGHEAACHFPAVLAERARLSTEACG